MKLWMKIVVPLAAVTAVGAALLVFLQPPGGREAVASAGKTTFTAEADEAPPLPPGVVGTSEEQVRVLALEKRDLGAARPVHITIAATGDVLMHMPVVDSVRVDDGYRFDLLFGPVAGILSGADYTVVNLETKLAGSKFGYQGFPTFNTPASLAGALADLGVDLAATANNHTLDMGWEGLVNTLDNLDDAGVAHVGTYRSAEEEEGVLVVDISGIKVGFLNYTSSTNDKPIPSAHPYAVDMISSKAILAETEQARAAGADVVVCVLHWGEEYEREPNDSQRELADKLLRGGVDVIIAHHPHVVQPISRLTVERNGEEFTTFVAYSLGNFVSNQRWRYSDSGIILFVDISKQGGRVSVDGVRYVPIYVQKATKEGSLSYRVLAVGPEGRPESDVPLTGEDKARISQVWEELLAHLSKPEQSITAVQ